MAYSKVTLNGTTMMDVTQDTVVANHLLDGDTATGANGVRLTGTLQSTVAIDPTLSIEGDAADAKATGDAISALGTTLGNVGYTIQSGKYADSTGAIASNSIFDLYSINVPSGSKIKGTCGMTNNGINYIWFYDGNGNTVGEGYRNTVSGVYQYNYELTVPDGACNVKISHRTDKDITFTIAIIDQTKGLQSLAAHAGAIPLPPTTNGTYNLRCVVTNGTPTYSWVSV